MLLTKSEKSWLHVNNLIIEDGRMDGFVVLRLKNFYFGIMIVVFIYS